MKCNDIDLDALVFGGLSGDAADQARDHLAVCVRCREEHNRLDSERRSFATRARVHAAEERGALPDFDALMARAHVPVRPAPAWRALAGQMTVAAAAVALFVAGVRHHALPSVSEPTASARTAAGAPISVGAGSQDDEDRDPCAVEEPVCQQSSSPLRLDRGVRQSVVALPRAALDCQPAQTAMPGALDRILAGADATCVPETI